MKVKSQSEVAQLFLTLRDPLDCSPPGSSVHGIFQARVLEWGAIAFFPMSLSTLKLRQQIPLKSDVTGKIYLGLSLVLWAVWGQFIFG